MFVVRLAMQLQSRPGYLEGRGRVGRESGRGRRREEDRGGAIAGRGGGIRLVGRSYLSLLTV